MTMGGDVAGEIYFFNETTDGCAPWLDANPALGFTASNFVHRPIRVTIHDMRGKENDFHLDNNGFEILKYHGHVNEIFDENSELRRNHYEDISSALKEFLGASRVIVFNHIFRSRGVPRAADQCAEDRKNPVFYAHVDNNHYSAHIKMEQILGSEEAKKMAGKRFQIINVWRPVGPNPITRTSLTICDFKSLDAKNCIHSTEVRNSPSSVSIYMISHDIQDTQKWYYLSHMRSDEMFIFKIFDTEPDVAQFGAHTAFVNEHEPMVDVEQTSIETRCLVCYD